MTLQPSKPYWLVRNITLLAGVSLCNQLGQPLIPALPAAQAASHELASPQSIVISCIIRQHVLLNKVQKGTGYSSSFSLVV